LPAVPDLPRAFVLSGGTRRVKPDHLPAHSVTVCAARSPLTMAKSPSPFITTIVRSSAAERCGRNCCAHAHWSTDTYEVVVELLLARQTVGRDQMTHRKEDRDEASSEVDWPLAEQDAAKLQVVRSSTAVGDLRPVGGRGQARHGRGHLPAGHVPAEHAAAEGHLRGVQEAHEWRREARDLETDIRKEFSGDTKDALLTIGESITQDVMAMPVQ